MRYRILFISALLFFSFAFSVFAQEDQPLSFSNAKSHWTVWGGYGATHPGLGGTHTRVEDVDLILQYGYFLTKEVGRSWYRGRHEILLELPVYTAIHPEVSVMAGVNFLACWDFTALSEKVVPYIFGGGGLIYTDINVPELGRALNGNHQVGAGLHYYLKKNTTIDFNYRFHHISNAHTATPNDPLNSSKILFGMSFLM